MFTGFKEFISRGNVVDLAVGIIIGGAFTPIVSAVTEVILGFVGALFGTPNFDRVWTINLVSGKEPIYPFTILTALANFLLIAVAVYFFVVVPINRLNRRKDADDAAAAVEPEELTVLREIRDLLSAGSPAPGGRHCEQDER